MQQTKGFIDLRKLQFLLNSNGTYWEEIPEIPENIQDYRHIPIYGQCSTTGKIKLIGIGYYPMRGTIKGQPNDQD